MFGLFFVKQNWNGLLNVSINGLGVINWKSTALWEAEVMLSEYFGLWWHQWCCTANISIQWKRQYERQWSKSEPVMHAHFNFWKIKAHCWQSHYFSQLQYFYLRLLKTCHLHSLYVAVTYLGLVCNYHTSAWLNKHFHIQCLSIDHSV